MSGEPHSRGLIDTNVVIHLAALDEASLPAEMVICAVTLAELSAGPHHTDVLAERARRMSVLQHAEATFEPLPFDTEAARTLGLISAAIVAAGRQPRRRIADLMTASIAIANRMPLYTTNPSDSPGSTISSRSSRCHDDLDDHRHLGRVPDREVELRLVVCWWGWCCGPSRWPGVIGGGGYWLTRVPGSRWLIIGWSWIRGRRGGAAGTDRVPARCKSYRAAALLADPAVRRNIIFPVGVFNVIARLARSAKPIIYLTPEPYPTRSQVEALGERKPAQSLPPDPLPYSLRSCVAP